MQTQGITAHKDPALNLMRLLAFGMMGFYLYKVHQRQGDFKGFHAGDKNWAPNPDRIVDTVMPWINMNPETKAIVSVAGKNLLRGIFEKKGMVEK